jgi:hypothetical protein
LVASLKIKSSKNNKQQFNFLKIDVWIQQQNFSKKFFEDVDDYREHNAYDDHCSNGEIKTEIIFFNADITRQFA